MKPEQYCCLKINLSVLGFLILQIPHKLKISIISISFATDFCVKDGLPPQHSKFVFKITLKSPASKRFVFSFISIVFIIVKSVFKTSTCSFSVLGLYKLIRTKFFTSMVTFKIKIRPLLSHIWFKTFTSNCPKKPIKTPQGLDNPWEKKCFHLKAYNVIHTYEIICLSETYLNHNTLFYDTNMQIPRYDHELIRVDDPSNQKRGGICIYHKDVLPINANDVSYLKKCLNFNLSVNRKQCIITLIYRSPSQSSEEFQTFLTNFKLLLDNIANQNPFANINIGDFNARSKNWRSSDKATYEGKKLESLTSKSGFKQVTSDLTHILESSSSFIDLIFTSQPNLVINSGAHSSLNPSRHHQIIHVMFILKYSIHLHINE